MVITTKFLKYSFTGYLFTAKFLSDILWQDFVGLDIGRLSVGRDSRHFHNLNTVGGQRNLHLSSTGAQKATNTTLELTAGVKDGREIDTVTSFNAWSVTLEFRLQMKPCISS
jgi:hypothetical protein